MKISALNATMVHFSLQNEELAVLLAKRENIKIMESITSIQELVKNVILRAKNAADHLRATAYLAPLTAQHHGSITLDAWKDALIELTKMLISIVFLVNQHV